MPSEERPDPPPGTPGDAQPPEQHRDQVVQADDLRQRDQKSRHEELRMNMMRSVVTEPLLSKVQAANLNPLESGPSLRTMAACQIRQSFASGCSSFWRGVPPLLPGRETNTFLIGKRRD